jgi:DNA-binding CsgD family transcriptional regulator
VTSDGTLSPVERRVLAMRDAGVQDAEIARRFRRSRGYVKRVARLADARAGGGAEVDTDLTPLERRVLKWRDQGARPQDMAWRFRRSPEHIARVEHLARYKLQRAGKEAGR